MMNTRQWLILGIGVLVLCLIILSAPKYIHVPHKGNFVSTHPTYSKRYQAKTDWDWVFQRSLPVVLIVIFLAFLLRSGKNLPEFELHQKQTDKPTEILFSRNRKKWLKISLWGFLSVVFLWIIACLIVDNIEEKNWKNKGLIGQGYIERDPQKRNIFHEITDEENMKRWHSLKQGASREQVKKVLGEPLAIRVDNSNEIWEYPEGGTVIFGIGPVPPAGYILDKPPGLKEWKEPNWYLDPLSQKSDIFDKAAETNGISHPPEGFVQDQSSSFSKAQLKKPQDFTLSKEVFEDAVRQYKAREQAELLKQKLIYEQDLFYQNQLRQQRFLEEQMQEQQQTEWFSQPSMGDTDKSPSHSYQIGQGQVQKQIQYPSLIQPQPQIMQQHNFSNNDPIIYIKRGVGVKRVGDTTIYDDGSTAHQIGGTTIFDNGSTARQIGSTTIFDDGSTSKRIGQTTIYDDGSTSRQVGSTVIYDDGGAASIVGHSVISDK